MQQAQHKGNLEAKQEIFLDALQEAIAKAKQKAILTPLPEALTFFSSYQVGKASCSWIEEAQHKALPEAKQKPND